MVQFSGSHCSIIKAQHYNGIVSHLNTVSVRYNIPWPRSLTWIFGALTIDKASLSFQVLFVVFNSLQGFFIFLFFCVLGRDGRELWLEFLSCGHYKSSHLHPLSIVTSSAEKRPNHFMLVSDNTSATPAPVLEKI